MPSHRISASMLASVALLGMLAALASSPASAGKKFYLTLEADVSGAEADTACANGFHLASLWEIFDFSQLKYDAKRGYTIATAGSGPPTSELGWVHTAGPSNAIGGSGTANCANYSSFMAMQFGTAVELTNDWDAAPTPISPWVASNSSCVASFRAWCKQD
jgi:hypothetical protein